jgi:UDP-N-acetylglucosamine:LPS N-acetylglucosamine transferase
MRLHQRFDAALTRLGSKITDITGTMYMAIGFAVLAFISFPAVIASGNLILIIAWITQSFLQLVALPIIIVGQNAQANKTEARDAETAREVSELFAQLEHNNSKRHEKLHEKLDKIV